MAGPLLSGVLDATSAGRVLATTSGPMAPASMLDDGLAAVRALGATEEVLTDLAEQGVRDAIEHTSTALVRVSDFRPTIFETVGDDLAAASSARRAVISVPRFPYSAATVPERVVFNTIESISNSRGFIVGVIDAAYQRWRVKNLHLADFSPRAYVTNHVRNGSISRHRLWLDALLGPANVRPATQVATARSPSLAWNIFPVRAVEAPSATWADDCLGLLRNEAALVDMLDEVHLERGLSGDVPGLTREAILDYVHFFAREGWEKTYPGVYFFEPVTDTLSNFTPAAREAMMGNQHLSPRELVHRLYDAHDVFEAVVQAQGLAGVADLWAMPGIQALVQKVITRAGHSDQAYIFELAEIVRVFDAPAPVGLVDYRLQVPINGLDGPDIVGLYQGVTGLLARLRELKSHKSLSTFTTLGGEIIRQPGSTLRRTWAEMGGTTEASGMLTKIIDVDAQGNTILSAKLMHEMDMGIDAKKLMSDLGPPTDIDSLATYMAAFETRCNAIADFLLLINTRFADPQLASAAPYIVADILAGSRQAIPGQGSTIADILRLAMAADPDMSVRKLMVLRMLVNKGNGTYPPDLLDFLSHLDSPNFVFTAEVVYPPSEIAKGYARQRFLGGG